MTFWKRDKRRQPDARFVQETVQTIGRLRVPDSVLDTPEWAYVAEATEALDLPVLSVALEVVASHHSAEMREEDIEIIEAIADSIRWGRIAEVKALLELVKRSSGSMQQAA